ncbi:flippase [Bacteriovoracaceae bacterium]|nr:flippase [Bacteriovoracaceae bacterium]
MIKNLNPNRKQIFSNTGWLFLEKLFRLFTAFFVTAIVAQYLGPSNFGILSYTISVLAIFEPIANLGINSVIKKYLIYNPNNEDQKNILSTILILRFISSIFVISILNFLTHKFDFLSSDNSAIASIITILSISLFFRIFDIFELWFESRLESKYPTNVKILSFFIISIIRLLFVYWQLDVQYFAIAFTLESIICASTYLILLKKKNISLITFNINLKLIKKLVNESWPLFFATMSVMIYMKIDQIMLKHMINDTAVGIYSAAVKISEPWSFLAVSLVASIFPTILSAKTRSLRDYYTKIQKLYAVMTLTAIVLGISTAFLAPFIINIIFGDQFLDSSAVLQIHIWGNLSIFWAVAQDPWDIAENKTKYILVKTLSAAILNVILNLWWIPLFGVIGAACATVVSYFWNSTIMNLFNKKTRKIFFLQISSIKFWKYIR